MNADASKFSLAEAWEKIRPHLAHLSFKRVRDYMISHGEPCQIGAVVYGLFIWDKNNLIPSNFPLGDKCFVVPVSQSIKPGPHAPQLIAQDRLFLICPGTNEDPCIQWAVQKMRFFPEKGQDRRYLGDSRIIWCGNDEEFHKAVQVPKDFSQKFWECVREWVTASIEVRKKATESLGKLDTLCIVESTRYEAQRLMERSGAIREAYAKPR